MSNESPLLRMIRDHVIGDDQVTVTPFGSRRVTYADYTASGRSLEFIEDFIRDEVLPRYANTHTETSSTGLQTTRLREDARQIIHDAIHGDDDTCIIFAGSGATGAVNKLIGIMNLRIPDELNRRYGLSAMIPPEDRPVVFVGPFEHHSNELPWRESIADVVTIPEDADGHIDTDELENQLIAHADRKVKIGSFSAASNVTGIMSNTCAIADLLHRHGALSFWDYAAAGPYVDINMNERCDDHPLAHKDAIFISPHKFVGGPGTPGVLAIRRALLGNSVPDTVGGGTVAYVNSHNHRYLKDPIHREEAGTPEIIGSIRAGLVFQLKAAVGTDLIREREESFWERAVATWSQNPNLEVLGNVEARRLSIVSFVVRRPGGRYLHHNLVVAILNDLFGIQSRGGCSCAGPYGHRLLGIDVEQTLEYEQAITQGCEGIKPGWVRVSFNYFISEVVFDYIVQAVDLIAQFGWRLLPMYRFDPMTGVWRHHDGPVEPPLRLTDVSYDQMAGSMAWPDLPSARAPESALAEYLSHARQLLATLPDSDESLSGCDDDRLPTNFEALRWFSLPVSSLSSPSLSSRVRGHGDA